MGLTGSSPGVVLECKCGSEIEFSSAVLVSWCSSGTAEHRLSAKLNTLKTRLQASIARPPIRVRVMVRVRVRVSSAVRVSGNCKCLTRMKLLCQKERGAEEIVREQEKLG